MSHALLRYASTQPKGSVTRKVIATILGKKVASPVDLDFYARVQMLVGLTGHPVAVVESALKRGEVDEYIQALLAVGVSSVDAVKFVAVRSNFRLFQILQMNIAKASSNSEYTEDLVQVLGFGGLPFPNQVNSHDRGILPPYKVGSSIFQESGKALAMRGSGGLAFFNTVMKVKAAQKVSKWRRFLRDPSQGADSMDVEIGEGGMVWQFSNPKMEALRDGGGAGQFANPKMDKLLDDVAILNQMDQALRRRFKGSGQLRLWDTIMDGMRKGKDFLRIMPNKEGVNLVADSALAHMQELYPTEAPGTRQALTQTFIKMVPIMQQTLKEMLEGGYLKLAPEDRAVFEGLDRMDTYVSDLNARYARSKDRATVLRYAATLPVGGLPSASSLVCPPQSSRVIPMPSVHRVLVRYAGLDQDLQIFNSQWPYHSDLDLIATQDRTVVGKDVDPRTATALERLGYVNILEGRYGEELKLTSMGRRRLREGTEAFSLL